MDIKTDWQSNRVQQFTACSQYASLLREHVPHRITQCYLPTGKGDVPAFTPANWSWYSISNPGGWVDLVGLAKLTSNLYDNDYNNSNELRATIYILGMISFINQNVDLKQTNKIKRQYLDTDYSLSMRPFRELPMLFLDEQQLLNL